MGNIALREIEQLWIEHGIDSDSLRRLHRLLQLGDIPGELRTSQLYWRTLGIDLYETSELSHQFFSDDPPHGGSGYTWRDELTWRTFRPLRYSQFLTCYEKALAAGELAWPRALDEAASIDVATSEERKLPAVRLVVGPGSRAYDFGWAARTMAVQRTALTAVCLELYRRATGCFPRCLDDLIPDYIAEVPCDPYTGSPLLLATSDDAMVVYSVGSDRRDDGGDTVYHPDAYDRADFGFRVPIHRGNAGRDRADLTPTRDR